MTPQELEKHRKQREAKKSREKTKYCRSCNKVYAATASYRCLICNTILMDYSSNMPECPTCHSKNIESVSQTRRSLNRFAFGINSPTARAQFECKNCGYKW